MKSELGHPVRIKFLPSIAFSIASQRPSGKKPNKPPGQKWARCFAKRHPEIKARTVKPIDWNRHEKYTYEKMEHWFKVIQEVLQDPVVVPENAYNMDETGVMLSMQSCVKVLVGKDDPRDYRGAGVKRTMVTAIDCISADGRVLLPLIIWPALTHRSNWITYPTPGWHYAHSENGYNNSKISLEWLMRVFDPQTRETANGKPRVLICDGFGSHETVEVLANNIILCRLPSHTSHKLQPCDVAVFAALKAAYRDQVDRLGRGGVDTIGKEHFTSLYSPARARAFTKRNITSAWAATCLFLFNPERVLRGIPKPAAHLVIPELARSAGSSAQAEAVQTTATPTTPVTPVNVEDVRSLFDRIKKRAETLDESSKHELLRDTHMMAKATRIAIAERSLLQDHNRFLSKINGEVKARRSTKSLVLGTAQVMKYEQLVEAQGRRAATAAAAANKAKRGRKRKSAELESKAPDATAETAQTSRVSGPWRAPVARMVAGNPAVSRLNVDPGMCCQPRPPRLRPTF
jgi:hypothetical protein